MRYRLSTAAALMLLLASPVAMSMPNPDGITNIVSAASAMPMAQNQVFQQGEKGKSHRWAFLNPLSYFKKKADPLMMSEAPTPPRVSELPDNDMAPQPSMMNAVPAKNTLSPEKIGEITEKTTVPPASMEAFREKNTDPQTQMGTAPDKKDSVQFAPSPMSPSNPAPTGAAPMAPKGAKQPDSKNLSPQAK